MVEYVKDVKIKENMKVYDLVEQFQNIGFQGTELKRAIDIIIKMKLEKVKTFLTFTSNMVSSGLRGAFAKTIEFGLADVVITTVGGIEEDIMKAKGEKFILGSFNADDVSAYESGMNRIGNIFITNDSYERFEDLMQEILTKLYEKKKKWNTIEMLKEIGLMLDDKNSFLYQAAKRNVPVFCPAITDGAFGFHLYLFRQKHKDFIIDIIDDFKELIMVSDYDEKKGLISLGGGISKHHAILGGLLSGGIDYAVYITTARATSGSMSGATTNEAKSWGKIKDDADAITVNAEATLVFPLILSYLIDEISNN